MRFGCFTVTLCSVVVLAWGCANGDFAGSGDGSKSKPSEESEEPELGTQDDDESADKSSPVSGAYLTCTEEKTNATDTAVYGCNLASDVTKKRIPLESIATAWKWRAVVPAGAPPTLEAVVEETGGENQATYKFSGAGATTRAYAEVTQIALDATLKEPLKGFDGFRKKLQETLVSKLGDPINIGPDADGDRIPDTEDLCSNTPAGAFAHPDGEYVGCAGGQFRDSDVAKQQKVE